ncbi:MAG: hypothetical protein HYR51_11335 [Candidatus Rokubacteria bacterium]|nr:hypothetical protein [Candidatus Rokubacteria bacterium]
MIDVRGKPWVRIGIVERFAEEDFVDGFGGRLHLARAGQILAKRFANQVAQRYSARARRLRGAPVEVGREQELSPVHV